MYNTLTFQFSIFSRFKVVMFSLEYFISGIGPYDNDLVSINVITSQCAMYSVYYLCYDVSCSNIPFSAL